MKISAVCTDIDGTLLDSRRELSARTISIFREISPRVPIILASSRMPSAMRHLQHELGVTQYPIICYNGGFVIKYIDEETVDVFESTGIPATIASQIYKLSSGTEVHISLYREHDWYAPRMDYWTEREEKITKAKSKVNDLEQILDEWVRVSNSVHKLMCMGPEQQIDRMEQQLVKAYADEIHIYRSRPTYLELAPKQISKATALEVILQQYGIPMSEVLAFGDNYNDIDMLRKAGLGVAVANSREEVKAVADETTLSSIDDGVAIFLEKCFRS